MIRTVAIKVAVTALALAASASMAHAGGGGAGGIGDTFLFDCYLVAGGASPGHVLTLNDQFSPEKGRTGVKLGTAKLLCTPSGATVTSGHDIRAGLSNADHIMCYEAAGAKSAKTEVQVIDPFASATVNVGVGKYVCAGAIKCPVGQTCPSE